MATRMPTLGPAPKKSPVPVVIGIALALGLIAGGAYWWKLRAPSAEEAAASATEATHAVAAQPAAGAAPDSIGTNAQPATGDAPEAMGTDAPAATDTAPDVPVAGALTDAGIAAQNASAAHELLRQSGLKTIHTSISGPLESAVVQKAGADVGPALTQVLTRALVWWVSVPDELIRGDRLSVLYEERVKQEPVVHAIRFESGKTGQTHAAFLFKSASDTYARFFEASGDELELRLQDGPLDDYEQVTSRLRDGRRHKGVDFKCAEGTPIKATFDGVVTRKNWNFRGNGNSVELREATGRRTALYLHLSEVSDAIRPGTRVRRGEVLGKTGNTGRSFAPHLHFQLMGRGGAVIDPFVELKTWRRSVPAPERAAFEEQKRRLLMLLLGSVAEN